MPRYLLKQKLFSVGDAFAILDDAGREVFHAHTKLFSMGDQLSFRDPDGRELAFIKQRLFAWGPTYEIHRDGALAAVVRRETFAFLHHRFTVDVPGPDDVEAEGNLLDNEYELQRGGRVVATVSKRWFSWSDTYGVDVAEGEDDVLLLASAVVIDMVCHPDDD